jgi:hypothetical protein
MKHLKPFENFLNEDISQDSGEKRDSSRWPKMTVVIDGIWDGDVSFEEATREFDDEMLDMMEKTANDNEDIYGSHGVPDPEDNGEYADLLRTDDGAKLIQQMIDEVGG